MLNVQVYPHGISLELVNILVLYSIAEDSYVRVIIIIYPFSAENFLSGKRFHHLKDDVIYVVILKEVIMRCI